MRTPITSAILTAALVFAPLAAALAQNSSGALGPATIGGQSQGSGGPTIGQTNGQTGGTTMTPGARAVVGAVQGARNAGTTSGILGMATGANGIGMGSSKAGSGVSR
jgi:hypothetical protein